MVEIDTNHFHREIKLQTGLPHYKQEWLAFAQLHKLIRGGVVPYYFEFSGSKPALRYYKVLHPCPSQDVPTCPLAMSSPLYDDLHWLRGRTTSIFYSPHKSNSTERWNKGASVAPWTGCVKRAILLLCWITSCICLSMYQPAASVSILFSLKYSIHDSDNVASLFQFHLSHTIRICFCT